MIDGLRVLAVVPARRGSKGLPLKNIRPLQGKPLLAWPVAAARGSRFVDRVIVSTDDAEFAQVARDAGAEVPFLRPAELADDTAPSLGFLLHALDTLASGGETYDLVALLEPTSPLTESEDIDLALRQLINGASQADAIVGVTALGSQHPAFAVRLAERGVIQPYSAPNFGQLPRRQDIEPLYALDGSLYISRVDALRHNQGFYHGRTLPYITPKYKSFEVDDLVDFICIEALLANRSLIKDQEAP